MFHSPASSYWRPPGTPATWNSVVSGRLIEVFSVRNCFSQRTHTAPTWTNVLLALWTMIASPVYGYTANPGGVVDNVLSEY